MLTGPTATTFISLGDGFGPQALREGPQPYREEREGYMDLTGYLVRHPELLGKEE